MKLIFSICFTVFVFFTNSWAQVSTNGLPYSLKNTRKKFSILDAQKISTPDMRKIWREDSAQSHLSKKQRVGVNIPVHFSPKKNGVWSKISTNENLWRFRIQADSAIGLMLDFRNFELDNNAELFIYSSDYSQIYGAYTKQNNIESGIFSASPIFSNDIVVEYYQKGEINSNNLFEIDGITYFYKKASGFGSSDLCMVNVNCSEGDGYNNQKRSVVRILMTDAMGSYWGTGTVINNTLNNFTPYIYTAEHNILQEGNIFPDSSYFAKYKFYFNYQAPGCERINSEGDLAEQSMLGCKVICRSHDAGGNTGSDFCLLKLLTSIPVEYNAYFCGWQIENTAPSSAICIHHPEGDIKKISKANNIVSSSFMDVVQNTHWQVSWVQTTNGQSVTDAGSSGSPLINTNGQIVGKLTGGFASCSSVNGYDFFGKISYDWASNGSGSNYQLKYWLNPNNSNITSLDGINNNETDIQTNNIYTKTNIRHKLNEQEIEIIILDSAINSCNVKIYSVTGMLEMQENFSVNYGSSVIIPTNSLQRGVYLINFISGNYKETKKLIIL